MIATKHTKLVAVLLALTLLSATHAAAQAPQRSDDGQDRAENVLLTVRLGKLSKDKRTDVKSYELVLVSGGPTSKLLSGSRVPFPNVEADGGGFVYQNVGFTTQAEARVLADGRIQIVASIEDSRVVVATGGAPPTVETRQLSVSVVLKPGTPIEVTRVDGIQDQSGFVEIEAEIVR